jgi:hypothetical protein
VLIKHPQHNGYQANLSNYTGLYILPEWHLSAVVVKDQDQEISSAEFGGGSISENTYFVFDAPKIQGHLEVMAIDTQGQQYLGK